MWFPAWKSRVISLWAKAISPYPEVSHLNEKLTLYLGKIEELLLGNIQDTRGITVGYEKPPLRIKTRLDCEECRTEALIKRNSRKVR
jgi:hypothetical protein